MSISSRSLIVLLLMGVSLAACDKRSAPSGQDNAATSGEVTSGEATSGEVAPGGKEGKAPAYAIDRSKAGTALPDFIFRDDEGKDVTLAAFKGKPILVNLWATWCAPCVAEMPQLDRIAGEYAAQGLQVLAISQDMGGADKVLPFFAKKGFTHIRAWLDPENQFGLHYATGLLPTSVLYDADGKEVARVTGALDWEGAEARKLIADATAG